MKDIQKGKKNDIPLKKLIFFVEFKSCNWSCRKRQESMDEIKVFILLCSFLNNEKYLYSPKFNKSYLRRKLEVKYRTGKI